MKVFSCLFGTLLMCLISFSKQGFFEDNILSNKFSLTAEHIELQAFNFFQKFMDDYNKTYTTIEQFSKRFEIFKNNLYRIKSIQDTDPEAEYGINLFADLSQEEFIQKYLIQDLSTQESGDNYNAEQEFLRLKKESTFYKSKLSLAELPKNFDWREKNVVSPIKNQGMCGSCWAFSAVQTAESHYAIKTGKLYTLSEQELLDCDKVDHACGGGLHYRGLDFIAKNGLVEEQAYPYAKKRQNCSIAEKTIVANFTGYRNITQTEEEMQKALFELGPISIGMDATTLQFYIAGVTNPWLCSNTNNHAVVIVGYGHSFWGRDYWTIKNSWGSWWGEKGYFRIIRGKNKCGMTKAPSVPIV